MCLVDYRVNSVLQNQTAAVTSPPVDPCQKVLFCVDVFTPAQTDILDLLLNMCVVCLAVLLASHRSVLDMDRNQDTHRTE